MLALRDERWVAEKRDQWNCIKHNTLITGPLLCEYSILKVLNAQWKIGDLLYSVAIVIGSLSAFEKQKEHSFKLLYGIVSLLWTDCCKSGLRRLSLKVEETKVLSWFSSAFVSKKAKGVVWRSQGNGGSRGEFKDAKLKGKVTRKKDFTNLCTFSQQLQPQSHLFHQDKHASKFISLAMLRKLFPISRKRKYPVASRYAYLHCL
ncbi:hypothetical protein NC651_009568 [Populus alba x Populus x berolinensis]|nr:hypothetical protein NC651_009568 [Populus alba x Populus x berolinensis]